MQPLDEIAAPGTDEREILDILDLEALPRHVAIIMDGNGRWAVARNLPRVEGHRAGIRAVRETIETAARLEIPALTLYAFSTENWKRPRHEVLTLMGLLKEYIQRDLESFHRHNLRLRPIGRLDQLDESIQEQIRARRRHHPREHRDDRPDRPQLLRAPGADRPGQEHGGRSRGRTDRPRVHRRGVDR